MLEKTGSPEASMVFEKLFTDYLTGQENEAIRKLLTRHMEKLKREQPLLRGLQLNGDGHVTVNVGEGSEYAIVKALSETFDSLMDITAFYTGQEEAFKNAEAVVQKVMRQFREPFSNLGIKDHILKGAMSDLAKSGVEGLDSVLGGGFPRSDMTLLFGPPGAAKYTLAYQFLAESLRNGGAGISVLSSMTEKEMKDKLGRLGIKVQPCEAKGRLKTIDWYSHKSRAVVGMEEQGHTLITSKDIANLDIAFTRALEGLPFTPTTRAVVEMITSALNIYELADVIEFVQRQKSRFRDRGIASIFIVEDGAHDERVVSTLKHMADGVISLSTDDSGRMFLEIESMRTSKFRKGKNAVQVSTKGITLTEQALDEASVIMDFCNIPKVSKDIAHRLVDAGYTDLQKLSQAGHEELMQINLVTGEIAKSITDYTRTVEYSHNVLFSRSEKWLNKAKEQIQAGDLRKAMKSLERALEIDPSNAIAWGQISEVKKMLGERP